MEVKNYTTPVKDLEKEITRFYDQGQKILDLVRKINEMFEERSRQEREIMKQIGRILDRVKEDER